jgi:hypothetical protein
MPCCCGPERRLDKIDGLANLEPVGAVCHRGCSFISVVRAGAIGYD